MPESLFECTSFQLNCIHNMTKVNLKLISGAEIYLLFEKGMRGELS